MARLVIENGPEKGKTVALPAKGTIFLGRDSTAAVPMRDTMASRLHCKIESKEDGIWVSDLESMNGTLLNGARVKESPLKPGDLLKVGDTMFSLLADDAAMSSTAGQRIGGYRLIERVGRGGMGTVYKAEQIDLQRIVALKVISEEHTKDKEFVDLFIHEARAAAKLNHPNIVQVYDVKRHSEFYYFSMEFVSGGSVQDLLTKQRKLPVDSAVQMILDAARGLDYAHRKGIIHRDVKPDNLMLSESGSVKIADMGLARGLNEKVGPEEETSVIGTPHYIAPEQVLGKPADFRSDIYALGGTMYRMLAGVTPHQAASVRDLVNRKVREDPPPIRQANSEVPDRVAEVCSRMMVRDPDKRYQDMAQVIADLEKYQREKAGLAGGGAEFGTARGVLLSRGKIGVAAFALAAVAVAAWAFLPDKGGLPKDGSGGVRPNHDLAAQKLERAELTRIKEMKKDDPKSIQKVIDLLTEVVDQFPGTPYAGKANESRAELEKDLRAIAASRKLAELDAEDAAAYRRAAESFNPREPDLGPINSVIAKYQEFAQGEEGNDTPSGAQAQSRAEHILKWKSLVERQRAEFDRAVARAREQVGEKRYRDALSTLLTFQQQATAASLESSFAPDRYKRLLYDGASAKDQEGVVVEAQRDWTRIQEEAEKLAGATRFEEAIALVKPVLSYSLDAVEAEANRLKGDLEARWGMNTRRIEEANAREKAEAHQRALVAFEAASAAARALTVKYDFRGASQKMKALRDSGGSADLQPRVERRVAELERAERYKLRLVAIINAKDSPQALFKFRKEHTDKVAGLDGTIESADDKQIQIRLKSGGTTFKSWTEFTPPAFYQFVKAQWKYNPEQDSIAVDQCDLAVICMEFALYEEALAEIQNAMKLPEYASNRDVARFCDEYRTLLEKGEYTESDEVEARKRVARMDALMALKAPQYASARAEIDALRSRFAKTKAFEESGEKIQKHLERINKEGGEQLNKTVKDQVYQKLTARIAEAQAEMKLAHADIVSRLGKLDDAFEKNRHLGAAYASMGQLSLSTERLREAQRAGDGMVARGEVGREFLPELAQVYFELQRNYVLMKEKKLAEAVRNEGSRRFVNPATKRTEEWWDAISNWVLYWSDKLPQHDRENERRREEVRAGADDPQKIWAAAQSSLEAMQNPLEARGYFAWLRERHPDFPQVKNGGCTYALAETYFAAREVREAVKLYRELVEQHPEHPKVKEATGWGNVKGRLDACYKLLNRMGYPKVEKQ